MTPDEKSLKRTSLRLRPELYARVEAIADAQGQSMNALISEVLEKAFPPPQDDFISYLQIIGPSERAKVLKAIGVRVEEGKDGSYALFLKDQLLSSSSATIR